MKKQALYFMLVSLLFACEKRTEPSVPEVTPVRNKVEKPYANPAFIYGSSFGAFFQSLYRNNNYTLMCLFTARSKRDLIGDDSLTRYYKDEFSLDYNLGKLTNIQQVGEIIQLTYASAHKFATRKKVVIYCVIENDSTKFISLME